MLKKTFIPVQCRPHVKGSTLEVEEPINYDDPKSRRAYILNMIKQKKVSPEKERCLDLVFEAFPNLVK